MTLNSKDAIVLLVAVALGAVVGIAGVLIGQKDQSAVSANHEGLPHTHVTSFCYNPNSPFVNGEVVGNSLVVISDRPLNGDLLTKNTCFDGYVNFFPILDEPVIQ